MAFSFLDCWIIIQKRFWNITSGSACAIIWRQAAGTGGVGVAYNIEDA